jgi:integrase
MKFTEANVKAHKDKRPNYSLWDDNLPGFGFRVQAGGSKVYYAKYRVGTKQRMLKIGRVDKLSLTDATKKAKAVFSSVADNVDPANTKAQAGAAAGRTFNPAYNGYLAKLETERSESYHAATKGYLENHFVKLHGMALSSIDQETASRELDTINTKRGPIAMNRARSAGSAFFNWAWREGLCKHNPFEMTNKNEEDEDGRERILAPKELKAIWNKLPDDDYGNILKLLALTLSRRTEIGSLRRAEINWIEGLIELPGKVKVNGRWIRRTKNGRPHTIPLSPPALAILKAVMKDRMGHNGGPALDDDKDFVFGRYTGPFTGWSKAKAELDEKLHIPHWVLHDLRRTGDTVMSEELGVVPHIVDAVMNHVSAPTSAKKGIRKKYNKAEYLKEKRAALNKYAVWLAKAVA